MANSKPIIPILRAVALIWILVLVVVGWKNYVKPFFGSFFTVAKSAIANVASGEKSLFYFILLLVPAVLIFVVTRKVK
jgi:hypothetical protein